VADCVIHWFRRDLRLQDNTALAAALAADVAVLPVFILDEQILGRPDLDPARLGLLRGALEDLAAGLRERGSGLVLRRGDAARELNRLAEETGAWSVYFNRDYTPYSRQRDTRVTRGMQLTGVLTQTFADQLLTEPVALLDEDALPPADFDAFLRRWLRLQPQHDLLAPPPGTFTPQAELPPSEASLDELAAAGRRAETVDEALAFGTLSVREVARQVTAAAASGSARAEADLLVLARRDFTYHRLHALPAPRLRTPAGE
jgi:deoxyribodipyrimidine photo-lyase